MFSHSTEVNDCAKQFLLVVHSSNLIVFIGRVRTRITSAFNLKTFTLYNSILQEAVLLTISCKLTISNRETYQYF
jgi:hypothetical protein